MEQPPATAGIVMANWYWKVVRQFVSERFGISLSRSSCLNWLHRLGFAFKRPKKRLLKADESKRETFVAEYAVLWEEAQRTGARIFFADEAHFRADAELRGKWVLKGKPALVDSSSPRYGEKASYYSAVCLETGEVEWMELEGNSNSGTSVAFLTQLKEKHPGPLQVIWDNAPAHRGEAVREYLRRPGLGLRLVNLPGYSPDFNADEAIWRWAREEATGNLCLGSRAAVQERVGSFLARLTSRKDEVKRRCRTVLQSRAESLPARLPARSPTFRQMHIPPWLWFSLRSRLAGLGADIAAGLVRLCFGSKRLWRKQHHLEANGYGGHEEWLRDWQDARSNEFFVLGSRDETAGCQLCVATVADDGTLTLRLRMPDCLANQHGKYLVIEGVRFAYGHEQVLAALQSNANYAAYRREHGEKAARATNLGQAISYRFKRDGKGWRVFVSTRMMDVPVVTDRKRGTIGVDLNADHLAVAETNGSGNYVNAWQVPLVTYGKSTHQAEALIGDAVASVVQYACEVGKPIVIGRLDFRQKKAALEGESQ